VVGESGAGKTTLAHCLAGMVAPPTARGSVRLAGRELLGADSSVLRALRWSQMALSLQGAPFNPVVRVGDQIAEPFRFHRGLSRRAARGQAALVAAELCLDTELLDRFPHQLSGGERRHAALAMAMALRPDLLVLDEPTAGVDPDRRQLLLERITVLAQQRRHALVVVSHDLADASRLAERTLVLYAGDAVESGATASVVHDPTHPYTWALVHTYPVMTTTKDLRPIRGTAPDPRQLPSGCLFHPRCTQAEPVCREVRPPLVSSRNRLVACHPGGVKTLLSVTGVRKTFGRGRRRVVALRGVSLAVREGESLGIVGPSGSGKTTLARIIAGHLAPDAGRVVLESAPLSISWRRDARTLRRRVQLILQDPSDALSPRMTIEQLVAEPLDLGPPVGAGAGARADAVRTALTSVGLPTSSAFLGGLAHELSGGMQQRVALARALIANPKLLVADEPTSMLDPSEQARLMVVLRERQTEMGIGLVLVSHDIALVRKVTDRLLVLDKGQVVETGPSAKVSSTPMTPTAQRLVAAAPAFRPAETVPEPIPPSPSGETP